MPFGVCPLAPTAITRGCWPRVPPGDPRGCLVASSLGTQQRHGVSACCGCAAVGAYWHRWVPMVGAPLEGRGCRAAWCDPVPPCMWHRAGEGDLQSPLGASCAGERFPSKRVWRWKASMCNAVLWGRGVGWPRGAWGEARRTGGYKSPSIPTEHLAEGRRPVERADTKGSPRRLGCVRRRTPRWSFAEEFSGKSSWLVVCSSASLHLSARMRAGV